MKMKDEQIFDICTNYLKEMGVKFEYSESNDVLQIESKSFGFPVLITKILSLTSFCDAIRMVENGDIKIKGLP